MPITPGKTTSLGSDEAYFKSLGLLTGLKPLIAIKDGETFPTPSDTYGTSAAVTNNILKWGAASASSWQGYDLTGGPYTKLLSLVYVHQSNSQYQYLVHGKVAVDSADVYSGDDLYVGINSPAPTSSEMLYKVTSTTWTSLASDATIWAGLTPVPTAYDPPYGMALYTSYTGGAGSQKLFIRMGPSQWIPLFSTTDTDTQEFQSVALWTLARNQRCITPFYVWGA